jgi:MoaA/NifB/PqqE/SkfB family radical SAM enzyme
MTEAPGGPWRITFDTNPDDCNLRCVMCEDHSVYSSTQKNRVALGRPPRRMDVSLIRTVVSQAVHNGLREIIPSTMGEPLLYAEFEEILEICGEFGVKLNLTTNGTFPRKTATEWAWLICPRASDVKVSLNGAEGTTDESVMRGASFQRVVQNLRDFLKVRDEVRLETGHYCRVTLQATFLETNFHELPAMVRLAAELGADRLKGHHLWVHFSEIGAMSMRRDPASVERWNAIVPEVERAADQFRRADGNKVVIEGVFRLTQGSTAMDPDAKCPFLNQEAWVAWNGRFNPCCAPDALRRTLGEFGNLYQSDLNTIWTGPQYRGLVQNYLSRPLCGSCNMRRPDATLGIPKSQST